MKTVILGAGTLGSILAAHLARAREDVTLVARGARAHYLKEQGITVTGLADISTPCAIVTAPAEISAADVLIVAVKTYDTESALDGLCHIDVGCVISVQNGVMKNEQIAKVFGTERTLGSTALFSGTMTAEGPVQFTLNEKFYIGELPEGTSQRAQDVVSTLTGAGIKAEAVDNVRTIEWSKFSQWCGCTALSVLTRAITHRFQSDPDTAIVCTRIIREAASLAVHLGIELEDRPPIPVKSMVSATEEGAIAILKEAGTFMEANAATHRMSALQDLGRGRQMEIEETLGYVVARARDEGVPVPTVETVYRIISGIGRFV